MNQLTKFLVDGILNEAESDVVTALFAGGFKPPTKGHLEVVLKAIKENPEIDQIYIVVGSGVRNGISQSQSIKIWEKYKKFIPKSTEIIESGSPIAWVKDYLKDHTEDKTYVLIGAREGDIEDEKDVEQRSNLFQKYGGEIKPIYTVGGISGTKARAAAKQSKEAFYQFLPDQLSTQDKEEIYNIILPTLNEVGEGSSKPYKWEEDFDEYVFTTDNNIGYIVSLSEMSEGGKMGIAVEFLAKTPEMDGYSSKIEVGKGELFRVMATIIDIIKSHLSKDPEIEFILYSPSKKTGEGDIGNQRDKLYKIFLQKQIPGIRIRDIGTSAVIAYLPKRDELNLEINKPEDRLNENASFNLDIPKFNYKRTLSERLWHTLNEISLSKENAVEINGDLTGGNFTVGNIIYEYSIKNISNPYKDLGLFYNIQFTPKEEMTSIPQMGKENYIKILSTMYKIIVDFIEKEKPEYVGISSLDNNGKNYHKVYANLTDNKSNKIPGYFRKDSNLKFNSPQGEGRFIVLKRKKNLNENATYSKNIDYKQQIKDLTKYMLNQKMNIIPLPKVIFKHGNQDNAENFFGKTAYYNPESQTIVLYTEGRHPKDIVRSFAHEMIHHIQNLEGRLGVITTTNTQEDDNLNDIEAEANLKGTMTFRNWTDSLNESKQVGSLYHVTNPQGLKNILKTNTLKGSSISWDGGDTEFFGISTTRNKNFFYDGNQIQIVLDGDKISNNYKIKPYDYWGRDYDIPNQPQIRDEDEEIIIVGEEGLKNIKTYILKINNTKNKSLSESIVGEKIVCDSCNWSWKIVDGGDDLFVCHKCGYDNSPLNEYGNSGPSTPKVYIVKDDGTYKEAPIELLSKISNLTYDMGGGETNYYPEKNIVIVDNIPVEEFAKEPGDIKGEKVYVEYNLNNPTSLPKANKIIASQLVYHLDNREAFAQTVANSLKDGGTFEFQSDLMNKKDKMFLQHLSDEYGFGLPTKLNQYKQESLPLKKGEFVEPIISYIYKITDKDNKTSTLSVTKKGKWWEYEKIDGDLDFKTGKFSTPPIDPDPNFRDKKYTLRTFDKYLSFFGDSNTIVDFEELNEANKPYKHKHGFNDKLGNDPFGLNQFAREIAEEVISEGRYDTLANKLSSIAFGAFKDIHDRGDKKGSFKFRVDTPDDEHDIPSEDFYFDFEGVVEITDGEYGVDGGANAGFDIDGNETTPLLSVKFKIPKNPSNTYPTWQDISFDIKDVIRHELEHLTQDGDNEKPGKYIEDDQLIRDLIDAKLLPKAQYFKLEKEIDAMLQGLYFKAKKLKRPYKKVIDDYLATQSITQEEKNDILKIWRSRAKSLSLPLFENESISDLYTIYLDLDGVIADFDKRFTELAGMGPREYEDSFGREKFWDFIDIKHKIKFFSQMDWMPEGKKLYNFIKQFDHKLLSAPSKNDASKIGKRIWTKENTPETQLILSPAYNKKNYADKSNILIDDRESNIQQWREAGGIGILFKSTDQVIDELKKIMNL